MAERRRKERYDDPARNVPTAPRGMRRLVVHGRTWHWRFGNEIDVRDPDGRGHRVTLCDLFGKTWQEIERDGHKRNLRADPSLIVNHIQRVILGYDDLAGYPPGCPEHGSQVDVRKGWHPFKGPRGIWQARVKPFVYELRSPEDVVSWAKEYTVLELGVEAWMDIKVADLATQGLTFDDLWISERQKAQGRRDPIEITMCHPCPSMPKPTDDQLERYVIENIIAPAALGILSKAA